MSKVGRILHLAGKGNKPATMPLTAPDSPRPRSLPRTTHRRAAGASALSGKPIDRRDCYRMVARIAQRGRNPPPHQPTLAEATPITNAAHPSDPNSDTPAHRTIWIASLSAESWAAAPRRPKGAYGSDLRLLAISRLAISRFSRNLSTASRSRRRCASSTRARCAFFWAVCWERTGQLIQSIRHVVRTITRLCPIRPCSNRQFGLFSIFESHI